MISYVGSFGSSAMGRRVFGRCVAFAVSENLLNLCYGQFSKLMPGLCEFSDTACYKPNI